MGVYLEVLQGRDEERLLLGGRNDGDIRGGIAAEVKKDEMKVLGSRTATNVQNRNIPASVCGYRDPWLQSK